MKTAIKCILISSIVFLLTGCLYPEERLKQNQIPYKDQIEAVQSAVHQYQEANEGLLPIKTRDMETPIYQKYPIDFNELAPRFISEPPGNAYESGGVFLYVLVDVETNPTVKLLDLQITEKIRDLQIRLEMYKASNGYPPFEDVIGKDLFTVDYKKLGYDEDPYIVSPFSGNNLPLMINNKNELYVDYRIDLYDALNKYDHSYKPGDDIRDILVENSMFVPTNSVPYTIDSEKNEPIFLNK